MKARYNKHQVLTRANMRRGEAFINLALGTGTFTSIILLMAITGINLLIDGFSLYSVGMTAPAFAIWFAGISYGANEAVNPLNTCRDGITEQEAKQLWLETISRPSLSDLMQLGNLMIAAYVTSAICFGLNWYLKGGSLGAGEAYVRDEVFSAFIVSLAYLVLHTVVRCVLALNIIEAWKKKEALKTRLVCEY